jgi:hypothetical protein
MVFFMAGNNNTGLLRLRDDSEAILECRFTRVAPRDAKTLPGLEKEEKPVQLSAGGTDFLQNCGVRTLASLSKMLGGGYKGLPKSTHGQ